MLNFKWTIEGPIYSIKEGNLGGRESREREMGKGIEREGEEESLTNRYSHANDLLDLPQHLHQEILAAISQIICSLNALSFGQHGHWETGEGPSSPNVKLTVVLFSKKNYIFSIIQYWM